MFALVGRSAGDFWWRNDFSSLQKHCIASTKPSDFVEKNCLLCVQKNIIYLFVMIHHTEMVDRVHDFLLGPSQSRATEYGTKPFNKECPKNKALLLTEWQNQNRSITTLVEPNRIKYCGMTETRQHSVAT